MFNSGGDGICAWEHQLLTARAVSICGSLDQKMTEAKQTDFESARNKSLRAGGCHSHKG